MEGYWWVYVCKSVSPWRDFKGKKSSKFLRLQSGNSHFQRESTVSVSFSSRIGRIQITTLSSWVRNFNFGFVHHAYSSFDPPYHSHASTESYINQQSHEDQSDNSTPRIPQSALGSNSSNGLSNFCRCPADSAYEIILSSSRSSFYSSLIHYGVNSAIPTSPVSNLLIMGSDSLNPSPPIPLSFDSHDVYLFLHSQTPSSSLLARILSSSHFHASICLFSLACLLILWLPIWLKPMQIPSSLLCLPSLLLPHACILNWIIILSIHLSPPFSPRLLLSSTPSQSPSFIVFCLPFILPLAFLLDLLFWIIINKDLCCNNNNNKIIVL